MALAVRFLDPFPARFVRPSDVLSHAFRSAIQASGARLLRDSTNGFSRFAADLCATSPASRVVVIGADDEVRSNNSRADSLKSVDARADRRTPPPSPPPPPRIQTLAAYSEKFADVAGTPAIAAVAFDTDAATPFESLAATLPAAVTTWVGAESGQLASADFTAALASPVASGCEIFLVEKATAAVLDAALDASASWPASTASGATSVTALLPLDGARVRRLQASPSAAPATTLPIRMVPQILEGIVIGILFFALAALGVSCVTSIATPDVLHSFHLSAGKEY